MPPTGPADDLTPASGHWFEVVPKADPRLQGRIEQHAPDGTWLWEDPHATKRLVDELNARHAIILRERRWEETDRPDHPGLRLYRFARPGEIPDDMPCISQEEEGAFVWLIRPGEMSPELMAKVNAWLADPDGGGRWRQNWPGEGV
jgi:hypothetical protein